MQINSNGIFGLGIFGFGLLEKKLKSEKQVFSKTISFWGPEPEKFCICLCMCIFQSNLFWKLSISYATEIIRRN